jgi:hypothetical protein
MRPFLLAFAFVFSVFGHNHAQITQRVYSEYFSNEITDITFLKDSSLLLGFAAASDWVNGDIFAFARTYPDKEPYQWSPTIYSQVDYFGFIRQSYELPNNGTLLNVSYSSCDIFNGRYALHAYDASGVQIWRLPDGNDLDMPKLWTPLNDSIIMATTYESDNWNYQDNPNHLWFLNQNTGVYEQIELEYQQQIIYPQVIDPSGNRLIEYRDQVLTVYGLSGDSLFVDLTTTINLSDVERLLLLDTSSNLLYIFLSDKFIYVDLEQGTVSSPINFPNFNDFCLYNSKLYYTINGFNSDAILRVIDPIANTNTVVATIKGKNNQVNGLKGHNGSIYIYGLTQAGASVSSSEKHLQGWLCSVPIQNVVQRDLSDVQLLQIIQNSPIPSSATSIIGGDWKFIVKNNGTDTIRSLNINSRYQLSDPNFFCPDPFIGLQKSFDSLFILPSEVDTIHFGDINIVGLPSQPTSFICFWTSAPNNGIDRSLSNNHKCVELVVPINEAIQAKPTVYPNPSSGHFNVKTPAMPRGAIWNITNQLGQIVQTGKVDSSSPDLSINLMKQPSGIYNLSVDGYQPVKLVKIL